MKNQTKSSNERTTTMRAAVYTQYGPPEVLRIENIEKPIAGENEILLKIKASAVNSGDWRLRKANPFAVRFFFGLFRPKLKTLGSVFSGEVESVGKAVTAFKKGDMVFGHTDMSFGAYAEYKNLPESASIALKPENITHAEAAVIPFGGVAALHFLKKANIKPGQKVLIVGASGAVGSAAIQLAKAKGAVVSGVCSTENTELVKSIGADKVIDYTREDFTRNGEIYDVIFDTVNTISISKSKKSLSENGIMILSAAGMKEMIAGMWMSMTGKKKVLTGVISHNKSDVEYIRDLIKAGKYKPVLERTYPLEEISEAHSYAESGRKKGNIALSI